MTPYSLAFYVDVVTTGTVLGLRPEDSPERVAEVLGADFGDNAYAYGLCRDHGLVEFHWTRASAEGPWEGHHFALQVHRLTHRRREFLEPVLRERYGRFTPRLRFDKLRRLLGRRGVPLVEIPEDPANAPYYRTFWQPESGVGISVIGLHGEYRTPGDLRVGDVYAIRAPLTADEVAVRRERANRERAHR
ncbi:hypothetical protein J7W19_13375 [Streptomyces mobaraensis NBRC 13819 = DSM 40847]|uniref:Uncharacterized protein n=1 Tax=Streptomyces mobaraensis (strain ATCC 29032 / DSM 40847 / JCM 4168 / NBRC 13819 / NCIMB 11159 / IPCR 16-22) TaxID=1223523 RepID=M3BXF8_STRM1|nr:hypothetical protein [Streptomyces mobaraensis]EME96341.1 hypothetical protein H340_31985 [Streptomyces mobaraensis NBRC 13819 = DSM 40847]QTT74263.1 hypothetical protein J7W19_13375 [Streptomyces mobaraensis NBRC 13819 = DSM 40847]